MSRLTTVSRTHTTSKIATLRKSIAAVLLFSFLPASGQTDGHFTIMTYNCENAFDTIPDATHDDSEYLPEGSHHWTRWRMYQKLRNIGKVIMAVDTDKPADIVCLDEVENDSVMTWLTRQTPLASIGYDYLITNSADARGIDVALLYSPFTFRPVTHYSIRANTSTPTRDILYVSGIARGRDTLDIFAVHLPSRLNGKEAELNRKNVLAAISHSIDSITALRPSAQICVLGDFNDGPQSKTIKRGLPQLKNLMKGEKRGSYKYHGNWECIDQILVTTPLAERIIKSGIYYNPMLLEDDITYGDKKPSRTYVGWKYNGGFSDHLPAFLIIR